MNITPLGTESLPETREDTAPPSNLKKYFACTLVALAAICFVTGIFLLLASSGIEIFSLNVLIMIGGGSLITLSSLVTIIGIRYLIKRCRTTTNTQTRQLDTVDTATSQTQTIQLDEAWRLVQAEGSPFRTFSRSQYDQNRALAVVQNVRQLITDDRFIVNTDEVASDVENEHRNVYVAQALAFLIANDELKYCYSRRIRNEVTCSRVPLTENEVRQHIAALNQGQPVRFIIKINQDVVTTHDLRSFQNLFNL